jgi:lipoprotein Spr
MYDFISDWWRNPYRYGGVSKKGIDCSAFMRELYKNVYNVKLPRTSREQFSVAKPIKRTDLKAGDLVFFKNSRGKWHVGAYIIDGFFVHSSVGKGVVVSNLKEKYYATHWFSQKRLPQLNPK